jgi:hypothetical protein
VEEAMGITVLLTPERGETLEETSDPANHLHRFVPSVDDGAYVLVSYIDWYGDTVFNRLQMPRFLDEWARLCEAARADGATELHEKIAAMATRCGEEVHLYLKFQGD